MIDKGAGGMSTVTQEDGGLDLVIRAVGDHVLCYSDDRPIRVIISEGFADRVVKSKGVRADETVISL